MGPLAFITERVLPPLLAGTVVTLEMIVLRSLESGAKGYVLKNAPAEELVRAIETVHGGGVFFGKDTFGIIT